MKTFSNIATCPVRNVLDRMGDKWSMLIILLLGEEEQMRFSAMKKNIGDISEKMLTVSLRKLEADGLISREVFPVIPPRVEYKLTKLGRELLPLLHAISGWADKHMKQILSHRKKYEIQS